MIIDWQHHFTPSEVVLKDRGSQTDSSGPVYNAQRRVLTHVRPEVYQIGAHIQFMDQAGIDMAVLSSPECHSLEDCIVANDALGEIMRKYPGRFTGLARCIPSLGPESLKEMVRAVKKIGLKGVCIDAQIEGLELDATEFNPFYETVSELNVPVFIHIAGTRIGYDAFKTTYNLEVTLGTMVLDMHAVLRLILGGVLTRFPLIQFVISHAGGGITASLERVLRYVDAWGKGFWADLGGTPPFDKPFSENFMKCLNRLYFDIAGYEGGMNAVKCALMYIAPEKLLFATDYPYNFTNLPDKANKYIENINRLDLPSHTKQLILGGNAAALLKL